MTTDIEIINNYHTEITRERNTDDEWDADDTSKTNNIEGFKVVKKDDKWKQVDLTVPFEINAEKTYYLVYVIYSTGDSFSHHSGNIDYIEMYETYAMAEATLEMIENANKVKNKDDSYSIEILNNAGVMYKISSSAWTGYFERLEHVQIDRVQLKL